MPAEILQLIHELIRNRKVVWKVFAAAEVPQDTSTQATSKYIKCYHLNVRENQNNCIFSCDNPLGTLVSLFYCSDINVLPNSIDDAQLELCNIWLLLVEDRSRSITKQDTRGTTFFQLLLANCWMIDDKLKSQIKN